MPDTRRQYSDSERSAAGTHGVLSVGRRAASYTLVVGIYVDNKLKFSATEFELFPDDGNRHEVIDGDHFSSAIPSTYHQTISRRLLFSFYPQIELTDRGVVFDAPTGVELSETDIVQSDLVLVGEYHKHIVAPKRIVGIPDVIVEILSPSNPRHDTDLKRSTYERTGVPEYWIVDPEQHTVEQLVMGDDRRYRMAGIFSESISLTVECFSGVTVDLTKVW